MKPLLALLLATLPLSAAVPNPSFEDLSLGSREIKPPNIEIDLASRREPIPELIYAQFIEHLGRCIYGGIWAELLDDRKFYRAVDAGGSPWKTFGEGVATTMSRDPGHLLAGDQTPVLRGDNESSFGGIAQAGIGVRKGRKYVGYARLKVLKPLDTPARISLVAATSRRSSPRGSRCSSRIDATASLPRVRTVVGLGETSSDA